MKLDWTLIFIMVMMFGFWFLLTRYIPERSKQNSLKPQPITIQWASDLDKEYRNANTNVFIEFGFRSDGVMVWRKGK